MDAIFFTGIHLSTKKLVFILLLGLTDHDFCFSSEMKLSLKELYLVHTGLDYALMTMRLSYSHFCLTEIAGDGIHGSSSFFVHFQMHLIGDEWIYHFLFFHFLFLF